jgi:hypothetical protein
MQMAVKSRQLSMYVMAVATLTLGLQSQHQHSMLFHRKGGRNSYINYPEESENSVRDSAACGARS